MVVVIKKLETHGLIKAERRLISSLNRRGSHQAGWMVPGVPEAAYERPFGKRQGQGDAR
jgi:hypothetical protein